MERSVDASRGVVAANLLSVARVPLAALLWVAPYEPAWTLTILFVAGATDVLDGWVARRARSRLVRARDPGAYAAGSGHGAFLDGLADKVLVLSAVALVAVTLRPPWWALLAMAMREILFVPIMLAYALAPREQRVRVDFTAGVPGKAATIVQFVALVLGLLRHRFFVAAAIAAGLLGLAAALYYVLRAALEPHAARAHP